MENSKPQWIRLGAALAQCEKASGDEWTWPLEITEDMGRRFAYQSHLNKYLSEAGASGLLIFKGVKITDKAGARNGPIEIVPPEYFRLSRTFVAQRHEIESWSDSEPMDEFIVARKLGGRSPKWLDAVVARAAFEAWLPVWLEKWLAEAVRHGWRTPEEAAALMQAAGMAVKPAPINDGAKMENDKRLWHRLGQVLEWCAEEVEHSGDWLPELSSEHARTAPAQYMFQSHLNRSLSEAGRSGLLAFYGVKIIGGEDEYNVCATREREDVPLEYFEGFCNFIRDGDEIYRGAARDVYGAAFDFVASGKEEHPNNTRWVDVLVEIRGFETWLPMWSNDWLREAIKLGRLPTVAAEMAVTLESGSTHSPLLPKPVNAQSRITTAELEAAYIKRRDEWPSEKPTPPERDDRDFLKTLKPDITRDRAREIRKKLAPENWKKSGKRKSRV